MQTFGAYIAKGTFDDVQTTVTLEINRGDSGVISELSKMTNQILQAKIGHLSAFSCTLKKGGFNEKSVFFTLSMDAGINVILDLARMAEIASPETVTLHNPQKVMDIMDNFAEGVAILPGIESVTMNGHEIKSKRKSSRPKTDAMLAEQARLHPVMELTTDENGVEFFNGKRYSALTDEEKKIVNQMTTEEK